MITSRTVFVAFILASTACGGKAVDQAALPTDPAAAVREFMQAVAANDIEAMGAVWGSDKGPAETWMKRDELQKRLLVVRSYLTHERFTIEPGGLLPGDSDKERIVRVRLVRSGCEPVVPFTTLQYRDRWIISAIDLEAAGNPRRPCSR